MSTWDKLAENLDWGGDVTFSAEDRQVIREVFTWFAEQVRPKNTIGACPEGDPNYVWQAIIGNKFKEFEHE